MKAALLVALLPSLASALDLAMMGEVQCNDELPVTMNLTYVCNADSRCSFGDSEFLYADCKSPFELF